jgi:hypothetical protein
MPKLLMEGSALHGRLITIKGPKNKKMTEFFAMLDGRQVVVNIKQLEPV